MKLYEGVFTCYSLSGIITSHRFQCCLTNVLKKKKNLICCFFICLQNCNNLYFFALSHLAENVLFIFVYLYHCLGFSVSHCNLCWWEKFVSSNTAHVVIFHLVLCFHEEFRTGMILLEFPCCVMEPTNRSCLNFFFRLGAK